MNRCVLALALLVAWPALAQVPEAALMCISREPSIGSPTPELIVCGWHQSDVAQDELRPVPPEWARCHRAAQLPLRAPRRRTLPFTTPRGEATCLTKRISIYRRCAVLCPSELEEQKEIFADGFESGDTSAWSVTR